MVLLKLYMVTDGDETNCGDHSVMYINNCRNADNTDSIVGLHLVHDHSMTPLGATCSSPLEINIHALEMPAKTRIQGEACFGLPGVC